MGHLDKFTGKPIQEAVICPPEIHIATNGFVVRTYDAATDEIRYSIAANVEDVRRVLNEWRDAVCAALDRSIDHRIAEAKERSFA